MTFKIILKGKVQGCGFRDFARIKASTYNIKGYVKNLKDGSVGVIAQGKTKDLQKFIQEIKRGPLTSHVEDVKLEEMNIKKE